MRGVIFRRKFKANAVRDLIENTAGAWTTLKRVGVTRDIKLYLNCQRNFRSADWNLPTAEHAASGENIEHILDFSDNVHFGMTGRDGGVWVSCAGIFGSAVRIVVAVAILHEFSDDSLSVGERMKQFACPVNTAVLNLFYIILPFYQTKSPYLPPIHSTVLIYWKYETNKL